MINYLYDCYTILNKVYSNKTYVKQAIKDSVIEEKNRALTIKTVYGVLDKDIQLSYYIKVLTDKSPKLVIRTVLKISMYAIKYLGKKEYAVTENAVSLVKKLGKGATSGFVNAFLRRFIKEQIALPSDELESLSISCSYPQFIIKELLLKYPKDRVEKIISAENPFNTLCFYDIDGEEYLKNKGIDYQNTPFENVYFVKNFVMNEDFDKGLYTFQSIGSVAISEEINNVKNLIDCCSAPGGKAVRLSYKVDDIVACDIHPHRVELIKSYCSRMKRENVKAIEQDSKVMNNDFVDKFEGVLIDAPCSGTGVINDNPDIKLNRTKEDIDSLIEEQRAILNNAKNYVKKGGYLYYSTCSILDSENIDNVVWFLDNNKNFTLQNIDSKLPHENINGANLFLPDISNGVGFFIAKLKRED